MAQHLSSCVALFVTFAMMFISLPEATAQSKNVVGAISGSFDVTLAGSATYRIPIRVAPGTAGTEPKIALSYDSQAAASSLGAGWSLTGLSAITRGPKSLYFDGIIDGVKLQETDAIYLDGQRLVPIATSGSGPSLRIEYRKEIDDQTQVVQFGPHFTTSRFVARTKGGLIIVFNGDGKSRVSFGSGQTLAHAASYIFDTAGNFISFSYENSGDGDYDISNISYTGRGKVDETGSVQVERRGFAAVEFKYDSASRAIESFIGGQSLKKKRRLNSIRSVVSEDPGLPQTSWQQVSRYAFEFEDRTTTTNRFVLAKVREFGEDESEITPTAFSYSSPEFEWRESPYSLPQGIAFARRHELGGAYRFVRFSEQSNNLPDLLVAALIDGKLDAFAYQNKGNGQWDAVKGFNPPFGFTNGSGDDLGALLIDLNGDDRIDLLQSYKAKDNVPERRAFLAGKDTWLPAEQAALDYRLPFNLSVDGKRVANVLTGKLAPGRGLDLLYESEGQTGFLENTAAGWKINPALAPPVSLGYFATLFDVDCDGSPELLAIESNGAGVPSWRIFRFSPTGWLEETDAKFSPDKIIPATINPRALLELRWAKTTCQGLIAATRESGGFHAALVASSDGWMSVPQKVPPFDLVAEDGDASLAISVDVNSDGNADVIANRARDGKAPIKFAYLQTDSDWVRNDSFEPPALSGPLVAEKPVSAFVGDLEGDKFPEVVLPGGSDQGLGRVFRGSASGFQEVADYGPKVPFARADQQDRGIRLLDLNGDGLPDIVFNREEANAEKQKDSKGAFINTGRGWLPSSGLTPPLPFASDKITGNPAQFVDVDGDGYLDLLYAYKKADDTLVRGYYRNLACDPSNPEDSKICNPGRKWDYRFDRKWVLEEKAPGTPSDLAPPLDYPFGAEKSGDLGVRFVDIDGNGRADILVGYLPPRASSDGGEPIERCDENEGAGKCELNRDFFKVAAFLNTGKAWARAPQYDPPVPFVFQQTVGERTQDLFVQLVDVDGDRLSDIVSGFKHPYDPAKDVFETWLNTGSGWRLSTDVKLPDKAAGVKFYLDEPLRDRRALVQWSDVNGDGLSDIVFSKRNGSNNASLTFVSTGRGFVDGGANWKLPIEAVADRDGDPTFRLVDLNGDGSLDVVYARIVGGQKDAGLFLNNGAAWVAADKKMAERVPAFIDEAGLDQGVRLFDVDGNGLLDVLQSFASGAGNTLPVTPVLLNTGRRSDVLASINTGYGLSTQIYYQTLLETTRSELAGNEPPFLVPWDAVYDPGQPQDYPIISPVPAAYVVRRAVVDEGSGRKLAFSYRYGDFRIHGQAMRPLGFGWREAYNEASESGIVTRTEMMQDVRGRNSIVREATCWVPIERLVAPQTSGNFVRPFDPVWSNLCPSTIPEALSEIRKLSETTNAWSIEEGIVGGISGLPSRTVRQISLRQTKTATFELDGGQVSGQTDTIRYDEPSKIVDRRQNVLEMLSERDDGTSVRTINEYGQDDTSRWLFGRLTKSVVTKIGDVSGNETSDRHREVRTAVFGYEPVTGLLSFEIANAHVPHVSVRSDYGRDEYGNIISSRVSAPFEDTRLTRNEFDPLGRFSVAEINPLNHRIGKVLNATTGAPRSVVGANGQMTEFEYDGFGRLQKETSAIGTVSSSKLIPSDALQNQDATKGLSVAYAIQSDVEGRATTFTLVDNKGRTLRTITEGFTPDDADKRPIYQETSYDILGRVIAKSLPHDRENAPAWAYAKYDRLGRVVQTIAPNHLVTCAEFNSRAGGGQFSRAILDARPDGMTEADLDAIPIENRCAYILRENRKVTRITTTESNMRKLPVRVTDALGGIVSYTYDAGDRVLTTTGPTGAITESVYNEAGQRVEVRDADMGRWRYVYDAFGHLVEQTDAKGQITSIEYDKLGRATRKAENDATTWWEYDRAPHGVGKISSLYGSDGYREDYFYDEFGRQYRWSVAIDNEAYSTVTKFDRMGRVASVIYPDAFGVENIYDQKGFLTGIRNIDGKTEYWSALDIDAFGRVTSEWFENGLTTQKTFDGPSGRPQRIYVAAEKEGTVLDLTLKYDLVGNLNNRRENVGTTLGHPIVESFEYDALDRLTGLKRPNGTNERYDFDAAGRLTFKTGVGDYGYTKLADTGAGEAEQISSGPFHAVLSTKSGSKKNKFEYDLNGNLVRGPTGSFGYTSDNNMELLYADESRWSKFNYAPSGERYRQFERSGINSTETIYLGAYERITEFGEPLTVAGLGKLVRHRHYISNSEGVFATVEVNGERANRLNNIDGSLATRSKAASPLPPIQTTKVWYLHRDQLGSVLRITDETSRVAAAFWYDPWGKQTSVVRDPKTGRPGEKLEKGWGRGFTGHEHLAEFALIHMNGRVYNPITAQFTSSDPAELATSNTQALGRYRYAMGNPVRYTDPTGLWDFGGAIVGGIVGFVTGGPGGAIAGAILGGNDDTRRFIQDNWKTAVIVGATVAVTVATGGAGAGIGYAILAGAAGGATGGALSAALYGGTFDDVMAGAIKGAVVGAWSGAIGYGVTSAGLQGFSGYAAQGVGSGATSVLRGEEFGRGFAIGFATAMIASGGSRFDINKTSVLYKATVGAITGGVASRLSGGKFENGAVAGAFAATFSHYARKAMLNEGRGLTSGERQTVMKRFGSSVNPDRVRVVDGVWNEFQDPRRAMAPNGNIYMGNDYCQDFSADTCRSAPTFIHEMTHVTQYQDGQEVILRGGALQMLDRLGVDVYTPPSGVPFERLNLEQQGKWMEDDYLLNEGRSK